MINIICLLNISFNRLYRSFKKYMVYKMENIKIEYTWNSDYIEFMGKIFYMFLNNLLTHHHQYSYGQMVPHRKNRKVLA